MTIRTASHETPAGSRSSRARRAAAVNPEVVPHSPGQERALTEVTSGAELRYVVNVSRTGGWTPCPKLCVMRWPSPHLR